MSGITTRQPFESLLDEAMAGVGEPDAPAYPDQWCRVHLIHALR
jgi:hypothetical protein